MGGALRAGHPDRLVVGVLEVEQEARYEYCGDPEQRYWLVLWATERGVGELTAR